LSGGEEYEEAWQIYPAQEGDEVPCCMVTEGAWTWFGSVVFILTLLGTCSTEWLSVYNLPLVICIMCNVYVSSYSKYQ
jgi:hypothetical protein